MLLVGQATCFQEHLCDTVARGSFCTAVLTNPTSADNSQHRSRKPAGIIQEVVAFVEKAPRGKSQNQTHPNTSKHLFQSFIIVYVLDPLVEDTCGISIPYAVCVNCILVLPTLTSRSSGFSDFFRVVYIWGSSTEELTVISHIAV